MLNAFTWVFLAALAAATATRLWLAMRQVRHVRAHRDAVPAAFAATIPLASHQKAADYTVAKARLGETGTVLNVVVLLAFTLGGGVQWIAECWQALFAPQSLWHGVAVIVSVLALTALIGLPVTLYRIFVVEERFGFNRMTWRLFAVDVLKGIALSAVIGIPLLLVILWLMQKAGSFWWLWAWGVLTAFMLVMQIVVPMFIMPWFNKFSPLEDPVLASKVAALLERCGFRSQGLFVMDGSKRSAHGNAFFSGFGASKRIVFFDTLLSRLTPAEVEAVLAHELGHYKLNHVKKGLVIAAATTLIELAILGLLAGQPWFYEGLGVQMQTLPVALLLFLLVSPTFDFFLSPLTSLVSRKHEFEADRYATQHAAAAELVGALVKLYKDNASTLTPDPLHSAFYDSHPPASIRIARLKTA